MYPIYSVLEYSYLEICPVYSVLEYYYLEISHYNVDKRGIVPLYIIFEYTVIF